MKKRIKIEAFQCLIGSALLVSVKQKSVALELLRALLISRHQQLKIWRLDWVIAHQNKKRNLAWIFSESRTDSYATNVVAFNKNVYFLRN